MIKKSELKNKKVAYRDLEGALRSGTVLRVSGNVIAVATIARINGRTFLLNRYRIRQITEEERIEMKFKQKKKYSIHLVDIMGVYYRNKLVEIDWSRSA